MNNERLLKLLRNADTFRTYDVTPLLATTTTLRRVHDILQRTSEHAEFRAILNLQDDVNAAAALGCLAAVKRHPHYGERTYQGQDIHFQMRGKRMVQRRMDEAERFAIWQRIAPAFPAGSGTYVASEESLTDSCLYKAGDTWFSQAYGKTVYQDAPAIMARNMPLPEVVVESDAPYVMASRYPNGPYCVATEGRVAPDDQWYYPRAHVAIRVADSTEPVGVFGHYASLKIETEGDLTAVHHSWAQDLLADAAVNILPQVKIAERTMTIPGDLIDEIGTSAGTKGDNSVPGLVIQIEEGN